MTDGADAEAGAALALAGIVKRFGATVAVSDVSLSVRAGTVHALLGENGAGKSTLMRVAFGLLQPDAGTIRVRGVERRLRSPADAIALGVGMVHQHFTNVAAMTVAENVSLGGHGLYDARAAVERVRALGERTGLVLDPAASAGDLPVGAQQRLEILKALARDARLLILDEPTAVLAPGEADDLLAWLRRFADAGNAVMLITHKLREALSIADDVTVMRQGRRVLAAAARELTAAQLATAIVGDAEQDDAVLVPETDAGEPVVELDAVDLTDARGARAASGVSFVVRAGEVVGIAAVEGAGQRELLRVLAGRASISRGALRPAESVAFIPEDRHADALVLDFDQAENVVLRNAGTRRGIIDWRKARARAAALAAAFDVRGGDVGRPVAALSGGNQQKLVLARELDERPALVVAENPTRGLDIRATAAVHARLREAAARGAGVVVYSSDLDEVLSLATRLLVMHAGRLTEVPRDRDLVGRAMLGVA